MQPRIFFAPRVINIRDQTFI